MRIATERVMFGDKDKKWALNITVDHMEVVDALRSLDCQVLTVDIDLERRADITCPPEQWEYKTYPQGNFDDIWFRVVTSNRIHSDLVARFALFLELADYFQPRIWVLQVPRGHTLTKDPILADIPFVELDK